MGFLFAATTTEAAKRCEVQAPVTGPSGSRTLECLDLDALNGQAVDIPSNVTRIGADGLALCARSETVGSGSADIVYIVDQSQSMSVSKVYIANGDTSYHEENNSAYADYTNCGTLEIPYEAGTKTIDKICDGVDSGRPGKFSGDPFGQRGIAVENAVRMQARISPNSTAGYIGFSTDLHDTLSPVTLNTPENVEAVVSKTKVIRGSGTRYGNALEVAKRWLTDPSLRKSDNPGVIFISDGDAKDDSFWGFLDSTHFLYPGVFPPIYGIYLADPDHMLVSIPNNDLSNLAKSTGGQFYLVPSDRPDSLEQIIQDIVGNLLTVSQPRQARLENLDQTRSAEAGIDDFEPLGDNNFRVKLEHPVALQEGENRIRLISGFERIDHGSSYADTTEFTLRVSASPVETDDNLPGGLLSVTCTETASLAAGDQNGNAISSLSNLDSRITLRLIAPGTPPEATAQIVDATTKEAGDSESLSLSGGAATTFEGEAPFLSGDGVQSTPEDAILQAAKFDQLRLRWEHPHDPRDTASVLLAVDFPQVAIPVADPSGKSFTGNIVVTLSVATAQAEIWYTLDGSDPKTSSSRRRYDSGPLTIDQDTRLRAVGTRSGWNDSPLLDEEYTRDFVQAGLTAGVYTDEDADGHLDHIVLSFQGSDRPDAGALNRHRNLIALPEGLELDRLTVGDALELFPKEHGIYHSGELTLMAGQNNVKEDGLLRPGSYALEDKAAPVAREAFYLPYEPPAGDDGKLPNDRDTLRIVFSESSRETGDDADAPFRLRSPSLNTDYHFDLERLRSRGDTVWYRVVVLHGVPYPLEGDDLWIHPGAVADDAGNVQRNPENRRVRLKVRPFPTFKGIRPLVSVARPDANSGSLDDSPWGVISVGQPPVLTGADINVVDASILEDRPESFSGVIIEASRPFSADVKLYDHLGHFVNSLDFRVLPLDFRNLEIGSEEGTRRLRLLWDGRAQDNSLAGTGAYIYKVHLTLEAQGDEPEDSLVRLMRVGIVRGQ